MGVLQGFERRLQAGVGNAFARLFGGSVRPAEVTNAMQREVDSRVRTRGGHTIAPNRFVVQLGPSDHDAVGDDEARVETALAQSVNDYLGERGWATFGDVTVDVERSETLHTGQFRIVSAIDPDTRPPRDGAGGTPMTHAPYQPPHPPPAPQGYPPAPPTPAPGYEPAHATGYGTGYGGENHDPYRAPGYGTPHPQPYPAPDPQPGYPAPRPGPEAVLIVEDGSGRRYRLQQGSNVIGRGADVAFRIPDTSVSRRHADVYFDGVAAVVHDLGSTNGTAVNNAPIQTWQLADGDILRLGHSTILFSLR